jgi:hypothetical protein
MRLYIRVRQQQRYDASVVKDQDHGISASFGSDVP